MFVKSMNFSFHTGRLHIMYNHLLKKNNKNHSNFKETNDLIFYLFLFDILLCDKSRKSTKQK